MFFPVSNRVLQGMVASALVLAGATACSRSDRSESGAISTGADTATASTAPAAGAAVKDTTPAKIQRDAPRAATATPAAESQDTSLEGDTTAAGYRAMERDTTYVPELDSARVTQDTSETSIETPDTTVADTSSEVAVADTVAADTVALEAEVADTAAAGDVAMARDTSATTDQIVDTTGNAGRIRPPEDSTEILGQVTTDTAVAVATPDTVESERIRPPEDSTEILGVGDETADEQEVAASESATDEVGAAAIGGTVTGADAVALMSRQGLRCIVVDPESNVEVRWDMSNTPTGLNPCGLGSMVLSKVWMEGQRGSEAAGQ